MSVDSSLIVRKADLPPVADLVAAIAETGVAMTFPADFALDQNVGGWLPVTVDGAESGFDYGVFPLTDWPEDERPDGASELGDTVLSFGARGTLSAQTVNLIQQVLGRRWRAALWIENEVFAPEDDFGPGASLADLHVSAEAPPIEGAEDMDPDLLATMRGTPAERAAALQRYVEKSYPTPPRDRRAEAINFLKPLIIPILIFVALGGFYLWSQLR